MLRGSKTNEVRGDHTALVQQLVEGMLTSIRHAKPMSRAVETHDLSRTLNASEKSQSACSVPTHSNDRKVDHRKPWATRRVTCHISDHRRKLRCAPNVAPIAATCSIILPLREHPFMPFILLHTSVHSHRSLLLFDAFHCIPKGHWCQAHQS